MVSRTEYLLWWSLIVAVLAGVTNSLMRFRVPRMETTRFWSSTSGRVEYLKEALLVQGPVAAGYGRGSKKLGVPTANLPHFGENIRASSLVNGVYFGWGCLPGEGNVMLGCVANIGKSPTFVNQENSVNIIEAHLLDRDFVTAGDFYGSSLRLCLIGFLREEMKFPSFDALISQINADISLTRDLTTALNCAELLAGKRIAEDFFARKPEESDKETLVWEKQSVIL